MSDTSLYVFFLRHWQPYVRMTLLRFRNVPPTNHIRSLIADGEAEHAMLTRGIADLTAKRDQIHTEIQTWRQVLCPFRHIPSELLTEIFEHFLAPCKEAKTQKDSLDTLTRRRDNPLVLTHVCAFWRKVAFNTPTLWTELKMAFVAEKVTDHSIAALKSFLSHSRPYPISLALTIREEYVSHEERLLEGLFPSFDRLKHLTLDIHFEAYKPLLGEFPPSVSMPLLESVDLRGAEEPLSFMEGHTSLIQQSIFSNAPNLRRAVVYDREVRPGASSKRFKVLHKLDLPWSQLTELSTGDIFEDMRATRILFSQCTSLEKCDLGKVPGLELTDGVLAWPMNEPVIFPNLRDLTIILNYEDDRTRGCVFFQPFRMPSLQKLDITAEVRYNMYDGSEYIPCLFAHSGSSLTHISLTTVRFPRDQITAIFQCTPSLVSFSCSRSRVALQDSFFEALTYKGSSGSPPLVPDLRALSFKGYAMLVDVSSDAVMDMVRSRWWTDEEYAVMKPPVARWTRIAILSDGKKLKMSEEQKAELERWQEEGLDISF